MMKNYTLKENHGFTLLEVIVAVAILAIGLSGTAALLIGIIRTDKLNNEMSRATALAQSRIEEIRQEGYFAQVMGSTEDEPVAGFATVTKVSPSTISGVLDIEAVVTYNAFGQHKVVQKTLLSRDIR